MSQELFFTDSGLSAIERVVLAEDIELPKLMKFPKEKLTFEFIKKMVNGKYYKLIEQEYHDVMGKFYLQILTPTLDKVIGEPEIKDSPAVKANTKGGSLNTKEYKSGNFVELLIPKYMVMNFTKIIPAGTEFLIASVGGSLDIEKARIIGLFAYAPGYSSGDADE